MGDLPAVPDYYGQFMAPIERQQQLGIEQQNANANTAQIDMARQLQTAKLLQAAQALKQQQQYQADVQSVIANPSAEGYRALMLKYPDEYANVKGAWDNQEEGKRQSDTEAASQLYAALDNGRSDLALSLLQQRKDAQSKAGQDDKITDKLIEMVQSGDPAQIKAAKGIAGFALASSAGPDKIGSVLDSLGKGKGGFTLGKDETRYDENGNVIAQGPIEFGGGLIAKDGAGAPGAASGSSPAGGFAQAMANTLPLEGGYNPKDANGSPTNYGINFASNKAELAKMGITAANFKDMTKAQAAQLYQAKYWPEVEKLNLPENLQAPYFDVSIRNAAIAKAALAKSGGDPEKFVDISNAMFAPFLKRHPEYAQSYASRYASNKAIAAGAVAPTAATDNAPTPPPGYHWLSPPGANSQYAVLTDAQAKAKGLDPAYQWQQNTKTGEVTKLGDVSGDAVLSQYRIAPDETGPSILTKLPAALAGQVKAMAEGRAIMPTGNAASKPYFQKLIALTTQYDPSWDANTAAERKAAITAFTGNGKAAQTVGSINRLGNHIGLLWQASKDLTGPELGWGQLNTAAATVGQSFEPAAKATYNTELGFVATEAVKIAKNSGVVNEGEVNKALANLRPENSAPTRQAAMKALVGIVSGAVDPLKDQYNSAFTNSSVRPSIPWIAPSAQKVYKTIGTPDGTDVDLSLTGAGATSNNPSDARTRTPPAGATKTATGPNGQKAALVNGKWIPY